jgi:hypothetical protein
MSLAFRRQGQSQSVLGSSLPDRAGHRDDFRTRARTRDTREIAQPFKHVGDHQQRCLPETRLVAARNYRETGSRFQRIVDEIVAVAIFSLNGEERIAPGQRTAVDGNA